MTRWLIAAATVSLGLGGCGAPPETTPAPMRPGATPVESPPTVTAPGIAWPYWPVRMRVHPLTRLTRDPDLERTIVEARVEFYDRDGNTTRCHGTMSLELDVPLDGDHPPEPVSTWPVDLRDGPLNASLFDPVTRTYLFKLDYGSDHPDRPTPSRLMTEYTGADGRTIRAEYVLPEE